MVVDPPVESVAPFTVADCAKAGEAVRLIAAVARAIFNTRRIIISLPLPLGGLRGTLNLLGSAPVYPRPCKRLLSHAGINAFLTIRNAAPLTKSRRDYLAYSLGNFPERNSSYLGNKLRKTGNYRT